MSEKFDSPTLVSLNEACRITSLSRTMVNRLRAQGRFPVAVELGQRRIGFVREEVSRWVRARISARDESVMAERQP